MSKRYLTGPKVAERYGWSPMTTYRREKFDPSFPKPVIIGNRKYFPEDALDAYDAARVRGDNDNDVLNLKE
jgi:predicted DNA-binding transcriptional regulator AlpA